MTKPWTLLCLVLGLPVAAAGTPTNAIEEARHSVQAWMAVQHLPAVSWDGDAVFRHRAPADGDAWTFRRDSRVELETRVFLGEERVVDQADRRASATRRLVERRVGQPDARDGWRVRILGAREEPAPTPFEVFLDRGDLYFWFEPPTPLFDDSPLTAPAGIPYTEAESTLLRAAGLTERPWLWDWIAEGPMALGTTREVPAGLAAILLDSQDLEVRSMTATLEEVRDRAAWFRVRARLEGVAAQDRDNAIPSRTEVDLSGTWSVDLATTRPRLLDLTGPVRVSGQGRQEDLALRLEAQGTWGLTLEWSPGG